MPIHQIRTARPEDIPILARHHRMMFEEICMLKGELLAPSKALEIESAYKQKLERQLPEGACHGWVAQDNGLIIASGAVTLISHVPVPIDPNPWVAYVHSIFTEQSHRGRGCARRIVEAILADCRSRGIQRVLLNASEQGRPIYERIGFQPASDMMRLLME